jgi:hypothetical protein
MDVAQNPMVSMDFDILHTLSTIYNVIIHERVAMRLIVYLFEFGPIKEEKSSDHIHISQPRIGL